MTKPIFFTSTSFQAIMWLNSLFRVLFPPPHNPPGLHWTPLDSTGLHWTPPGLSSLPNHILVLPILLDSSPVDSSWTPVDSSPLGKSSGLHPTLSPVDSSGLHWTPLDSTG